MTYGRFVILAFVVGAILIGWTLQVAISSTFSQFSITDNRVLGLVTYSTLLGLAGGALTFFALLRNATAVQFADEVIGELDKVTWPTREETIKATTTVVYTTLFVASLLGAYDFLWKNVADVFLFTEG